MNKRDLLADLKFCDRATQGPWRHDEWNLDCSEVYAPGVDTPIILVGHDPHDADFIVQAREGWPHAIERALKAEALARELVEALKHIERLTELVWQGVGPVTTEIRLAVEGALEKAKEALGDEIK